MRRRAQRHQEAVHLATKEAMLSDEDEICNVDALEAEFRSITADLTKICLGSAATALLGQLQSVGPCAALDQLIDLQRRHSILQSILHFEDEREREKVPQPPERPFEKRSRPGNLPPLTPRGRATSRASSSSSRASSRASSATVRTVRSVRKVSRSNSRVSVRSIQSKVKENVKEKEVEVVRSSPGPAAVGYREMSLQEMKDEIEEERKKYIAERLN